MGSEMCIRDRSCNVHWCNVEELGCSVVYEELGMEHILAPGYPHRARTRTCFCKIFNKGWTNKMDYFIVWLNKIEGDTPFLASSGQSWRAHEVERGL